jgi:Secretion system C-terminal sorting domain
MLLVQLLLLLGVLILHSPYCLETKTNHMRTITFLLLFAALSSYQAKAHVNLNNPLGGETYFPGDTVDIQWQIAINHTLLNWDLFFSSDGGANWDTLQIDIPSGTLNYQWIVPATTTNQAQIRIVMDNAGTDYNDVSGDFTIGSAASIGHANQQIDYSLYPNPMMNSAILTFDNADKENHTFKLYNLQGQVVQTTSNITSSEINIERDKLPSGLYFFHLFANKQMMLSGKLTIE